MRNARSLLCLLAAVPWLLACDEGVRKPPTAAVTEAASASETFSKPDADGWGSAAGLRYLEVVKGGAAPDAALPMVVFIHGMGDRPRDVWVQQPGLPMRVVMPQAPKPHFDGFSWFSYRVRDDEPQALADDVARAAGQLARAIAVLADRRPTRGKPVVSGFSQGGMLSYALAVRAPELASALVPISGLLPKPLWPKRVGAGALPPITALHGDADRVVPMPPAEALCAHLRTLGYPVDFHAYPRVGHFLSPQMAERLGATIDLAARRAAQTADGSTDEAARPTGPDAHQP